MNIFEVLESDPNLWTAGNFSGEYLVTHGNDYYQAFVSERLLFRGYGCENLELVAQVLEDVRHMKECHVRPTFIFQNWLQYPPGTPNRSVRIRTKVAQFFHTLQDSQTKHLVETMSDQNLYDMDHQNIVFIEFLCRLQFPLRSCDHDMNKTVVLYSAMKKSRFMATSTECGLLRQQITDPDAGGFIRTAVFSSHSQSSEDSKHLVCSIWNADSNIMQAVPPRRLPLLAFLSTNQDIRLPSSLKDIENASKYDQSTKRTYALIKWLETTECESAVESILSLYTDAEIADIEKRIFAGVRHYFSGKVPSNVPHNDIKIITKNELPGAEAGCNDGEADGPSTVSVPFRYDWPMTMKLSYQDEDVIHFWNAVSGNSKEFVSQFMRNIAEDEQLYGQFDSLKRLYQVERDLLTMLKAEIELREGRSLSTSKTVTDTTAPSSAVHNLKVLFSSEENQFTSYFIRQTNLNMSEFHISRESNFIACFLSLWLQFKRLRIGSSPLCMAIAASSLVAVFFLKKIPNEIDELEKQIGLLLQHNNSIYKQDEQRCAERTSGLSEFAKSVKELHLFVVEFRRLVGLVDVTSMFFHPPTQSTGKKKWPSRKFFAYPALWMLFPSSQLLYSLTQDLEEMPPRYRLDKIVEDWIPTLVPKPLRDNNTELEMIQTQFKWVYKFLDDSLSNTPSQNANAPD